MRRRAGAKTSSNKHTQVNQHCVSATATRGTDLSRGIQFWLETTRRKDHTGWSIAHTHTRGQGEGRRSRRKKVDRLEREGREVEREGIKREERGGSFHPLSGNIHTLGIEQSLGTERSHNPPKAPLKCNLRVCVLLTVAPLFRSRLIIFSPPLPLQWQEAAQNTYAQQARNNNKNHTHVNALQLIPQEEQG